MKYKKSEFNYIQKNRDYYIIYNTLYNSLVRLNQQEYQDYLALNTCNEELMNGFVENGLWVNSDLDERARYLACSETYTLCMPRPLDITVTTTLKCNARCSYCYEKGVKQSNIIDGSEDKIIEFIRNTSDMNKVHLIWFGGEPLLNKEFMDSLCNRLMEEKIDYSAYIITNGSLLNQQMIEEKFPLWNIKDMQITLDGPKEVYERIKNYKHPGEGKFDSIINSIKLAANNGVYVNIRLNIGRNNRTEIIDLLKELDDVFSQFENVVFYPAFLTGERNPLSEKEKIEYVKRMLLSIKNIKKLTTGTKFYSLPRMHACMNGDPKSFVIDVDGIIYSCEHYVGKGENRIGNINDVFFEDDIRGKNITFRKECQTCVFLPKCYGGCEANYMEGETPCMIEKYLIKAYMQIL